MARVRRPKEYRMIRSSPSDTLERHRDNKTLREALQRYYDQEKQFYVDVANLLGIKL